MKKILTLIFFNFFFNLASSEEIKIAFITTLSGPSGFIGEQMVQGFNLGLDHIDNKIGGNKLKIFFGDDQRKPDVAKQLTKKMLNKHKVHFITGIIWSNVLLAIHKSVTKSGTFLIGANAGPSKIAGVDCSKNFFSVSWQNDQTPEAMGKYLNSLKFKNVYLLAPNYQAGKDMLNGFERYYKKKIIRKVYTKLGQNDFLAEISLIRSINPEAVFIFQPGGMGINFVKQYHQSGLIKKIPLFTAFTVDGSTLPALKKKAIGILDTQSWSHDLNNATNKKFVKDFKKKYGYLPSYYAAQSYDLVKFIENSVIIAGGIKNKDKLRNVMRSNSFKSTRGDLKFNNNHFPIQNFYLRKVIEKERGIFTNAIQKTVFSDHKDNYSKYCKMSL